MCYDIHTRTHPHLTLQQFLQYCKTQVNYINHKRTDRRLCLKLFCLSAPSQLLHADPYYTLAVGGAEVRAEEEKGDEKGRGAIVRLKRIRVKAMRVKKTWKHRREGGVSNLHCRTAGSLHIMKLSYGLNYSSSSFPFSPSIHLFAVYIGVPASLWMPVVRWIATFIWEGIVFSLNTFHTQGLSCLERHRWDIR